MMIGFLDIQELHENYRQCRLYTRHYAKTFYFASHVLPREKRLAAYAVYSFCRYADEIADHGSAVGDRVQAKRRLADLQNQLRYLYTNSPLMDKKLLAFRDTVFRYGIPENYFKDLLRGVEMDLEKKRFADFAELNDYCYCVASVVGLIMTKIFGASDETALQHAADLGTAMQLTNILRDVGEDYRRGRIYLPQDEMANFGYSERDLRDGNVTQNFKRLMEFQIDRARRYYESAEQGIPMLTNDGSRFCVRLMSRTYARILDRIEKNSFNVFTVRAHVPFVQKLGIALFAAAGFSRNRRSAGRRSLEPFSPIPAEQM
ncbi:phytoene/squalene synthase family protein [Sphingobacteriales bacterium CHB3]|nr:phytoene/squalene synthase family protein [Sphingobacteriales bacterium CHB3]